MNHDQSSAPQPSTSTFEDHPLAELFPLMRPDELAALTKNIREQGVELPIVLFEGRILDGRNRYRACQLAGVEPRTRDFPTDGDPPAFVLSANLHRRHLTPSQRALIAAKIASLPHGGDRKNQEPNSALDRSINEFHHSLTKNRPSLTIRTPLSTKSNNHDALKSPIFRFFTRQYRKTTHSQREIPEKLAKINIRKAARD